MAFAGRNPMLSLALAGLTVAIIYTEIARLFRGYKAIKPAELTGLINQGGALVVDLSAADFEKGHIAGSRNIVPSQFDPENKLLAGQGSRRWCWCAATAWPPAARRSAEEGRLRAGVLCSTAASPPGSGRTCRWSRAALSRPVAPGLGRARPP
jgi:hypothetical protein